MILKVIKPKPNDIVLIFTSIDGKVTEYTQEDLERGRLKGTKIKHLQFSELVEYLD